MKKYRVNRTNDTVDVLLIKHKDNDKYSFVNLTKGHICPCLFDSIEDALKDMDNDDRVISYIEITGKMEIE